MKKKDISDAVIRQQDLGKVVDQIDLQGGYRKNIGNYNDRAESLADVIKKIKEKGGSVGTLVSDSGEKLAKTSALKQLGKKALGVIPLAGTVAGLMSGDPAMAAEEAAGDIVPGLEAIKSEDAGESSADERMMLAEREAQQKYKKSPARIDKLKALMNSRIPASEADRVTEGLDQTQAPSIGAGAAGADEITPEMEAQIQAELKGASEITPEGARAQRLKRLFNLKK